MYVLDKKRLQCIFNMILYIYIFLVVPHITDAIQEWVMKQAKISVDEDGVEPEVCVIEVRLWSRWILYSVRKHTDVCERCHISTTLIGQSELIWDQRILFLYNKKLGRFSIRNEIKCDASGSTITGTIWQVGTCQWSKPFQKLRLLKMLLLRGLWNYPLVQTSLCFNSTRKKIHRVFLFCQKAKTNLGSGLNQVFVWQYVLLWHFIWYFTSPILINQVELLHCLQRVSFIRHASTAAPTVLWAQCSWWQSVPAKSLSVLRTKRCIHACSSVS